MGTFEGIQGLSKVAWSRGHCYYRSFFCFLGTGVMNIQPKVFWGYQDTKMVQVPQPISWQNGDQPFSFYPPSVVLHKAGG